MGKGITAIMSPQSQRGDCGRAKICNQSSWVSPQVFESKSQNFSSEELSLCCAVLSQAQLYGRVGESGILCTCPPPALQEGIELIFIMGDPTHSKKKLVSVP